MQIHLDALGGVAGDMFVAALLDAFPSHRDGVMRSVAAASSKAPVACELTPHNDGILQGHRFMVKAPASDGHTHRHDAHEDGPRHDHAHRHWSDIRADLVGADLDPATRKHAIGIFEHLAAAEAKVHGIAVEQVAFHEVGAWDSIADIVAAAHLVARLEATHWSVGPLPLGSGRVQTAHGTLPVPAPATALLLEGFATLDDGIAGERVTPTGAAILRYLCDHGPMTSRARTLGRPGVGFGTKIFLGMSNCLRVLVFDEEAPQLAPASGHRDLGIIEFEVDDQSAEDLAMGLDRLREHNDIFDVVQMPMFGKKGRMMTHVRALVRADAMNDSIDACFRETTTIGLRHHVVSGAALPRRITAVEIGGRSIRVKTVERPGGRTAKAEADDALPHGTHAARASLRLEAERLALDALHEQAGGEPSC